ncbi:MAG TPA: Cache 3/Cache 2 fusion domain-containing protein [Limnobacter sp.]|uniref:methyl-accepting chemotaxis protein n=1 Tax=Limnobacter sp. TaxID=2003368 RepID=UPI002ED96634
MIILSRSSLTKQISVFSAGVILTTMAVLTTVVTITGHQDAMEGARTDLKQQSQTVQKVLDGYFDAVNTRAERQFRLLEQWLPGDLIEQAQLINTNGRDLPTLMIAGTPVNGNTDLLNSFKSLTGDEIAFLSVYNGKVYRASTLLRKDGKAMHGSEISLTDPVGAALSAGKDYSGLTVRGGKYFFSKVKAIRDPQGRVFAGLSIRISLDSELGQIRELFGNLHIADTGMVGIVRVGGDDTGGGEWVLHPSLESKTILEMPKDSSWAASTLDTIKNQPEVGELAVNLQDGSATDTMLSTAFSKSWKWLVVVTAPKSEFLASSNHTRNQIILAGILASLVCAGAMFWLLKNRLRPLTEVADALHRLGQGDLSAQVKNAQNDSRNEIDVIGVSLNKTSEQVRNLIRGVETACDEIAQSSEALVQQARVAKDCSEQQFDASSNMSATVEEMHATVCQVADNAAEAAAASGHVIEETARGRQMVGGTVNDMSTISAQVEQSAAVIQSLGSSSQQILNIVNVIQEIADKTNLLALNAAIEAARAGEQGRGFAVVADEVRKLAEQTSQSTQEISSTVGNIVHQTEQAVEKMAAVRLGVSEGVERAHQAGSALDEIDTLIERSAVRANDIAHSTGEQKIATERFAEAVMKITELAQRNNSASESSEQAARQMTELSQRLKAALQKFKTA